jgi:hypothetical protein
MVLSDLLSLVADHLERLGIDYCVTGSVAAMSYGEPRLTNDIDIAVRLTTTQAKSLAESFPEGEFYVSQEAAREAAAFHTQFNLLHPESGLKVDFMVVQNDAFNNSRFQRIRLRRATTKRRFPYASPEDVIIRKLEYYKLGGSEKHLRDIRGIIGIQGDDLDHAYIQTWASRLGVKNEWEMASGKA